MLVSPNGMAIEASPTANGEATLELPDGTQGKVKRAGVWAPGSTRAASAECLGRTAKLLTLSLLGADAMLEVPHVLCTSGRRARCGRLFGVFTSDRTARSA